MHVGSYDDEPSTVTKMHQFASENGYKIDISDSRRHHEIYLSDPRRCRQKNLKTILRIPVRKLQQ